MKKIFSSTGELDKNAVSLGLSELILQENASAAIEKCVKKHFKGTKIIAFCGGGNNGADALAAVRRLSGDFACTAVLTSENLNQNAKTQAQIAKNLGVNFIKLKDFKYSLDNDICVIDGIFGSGLSHSLDEQIAKLIKFLNKTKNLKIAVDIPSGLNAAGIPCKDALRGDFCVTMGAPKLALFSDFAKDFVGRIITANLGLSAKKFTQDEKSDFLLEMSDLILPFRKKQNVNKGDFGHAFVAFGAMSGAGQICALAALNMGAGKVSVVKNPLQNTFLNEKKNTKLSYEIMEKKSFKGADAIALGMGLGTARLDFYDILAQNCSYIVDADMFYNEKVLDFAALEKSVLTPHPKEFASLLKIAGIGEFSVNEVLERKMEFARIFSQKFPCVLLVKGANSIIAHRNTLYINTLGSAKLAKGGSGDALSGVILALLAQNYTPLNAAISASLAQAKIASKYHKNDYSYTPKDMIRGIKCL